MGSANFAIGPGTVVLDSDGTPIYIGYTTGETKVTIERTEYERRAQQSINVLGIVRLTEKTLISVPMGEVSLENLKVALDLSSVIEETGSPVTNRSLPFGGDTQVTDHLLEIYTMAPGGKTRKWKFHKANSIANIDYPMNAEGDTQVVVTFEAIADLTKDKGERTGLLDDDLSKDYDLEYMLEAPA